MTNTVNERQESTNYKELSGMFDSPKKEKWLESNSKGAAGSVAKGQKVNPSQSSLYLSFITALLTGCVSYQVDILETKCGFLDCREKKCVFGMSGIKRGGKTPLLLINYCIFYYHNVLRCVLRLFSDRRVCLIQYVSHHSGIFFFYI